MDDNTPMDVNGPQDHLHMCTMKWTEFVFFFGEPRFRR